MEKHAPFLVLALVTTLLVVAIRAGEPDPEATAAIDRREAALLATPAPDTVVGAERCRRAGYLCAGLAERDEPRITRWADDTPSLTVRIPVPPHEDEMSGRALQRAAARGIRSWHGHPFPIRVEMTDRAVGADIVVTWTPALDGTELGRVRSRWLRVRDEITLSISEFALVTRHPLGDRRLLDETEVELAAAHEMGHALGLPHSDDPDDVMYPTNTASRLTSQDFLTVAALYRLENGARVEVPSRPADRPAPLPAGGG